MSFCRQPCFRHEKEFALYTVSKFNIRFIPMQHLVQDPISCLVGKENYKRTNVVKGKVEYRNVPKFSDTQI